MILSKNDLRFYIEEDKKACLKYGSGKSIIEKIYYFMFPTDNIMAFRYLRSLRNLEYATNCLKSNGVVGKIRYLYYKARNRHYGVKYGIFIAPNTVGYGFYIPHVVGGGIILNSRSIGNYCSANAGVVVGVNHTQDSKPIIGNNVAMNIGCKIVGKITIGDNVTIGPNTVIYKDVPSDCVVLGVPAQVIRRKDSRKV